MSALRLLNKFFLNVQNTLHLLSLLDYHLPCLLAGSQGFCSLPAREEMSEYKLLAFRLRARSDLLNRLGSVTRRKAVVNISSTFI